MSNIEQLEAELKEAKKTLKERGQAFIDGKKHGLINILQQTSKYVFREATHTVDNGEVNFYFKRYSGYEDWRDRSVYFDYQISFYLSTEQAFIKYDGFMPFNVLSEINNYLKS